MFKRKNRVACKKKRLVFKRAKWDCNRIKLGLYPPEKDGVAFKRTEQSYIQEKSKEACSKNSIELNSTKQAGFVTKEKIRPAFKRMEYTFVQQLRDGWHSKDR